MVKLSRIIKRYNELADVGIEFMKEDNVLKNKVASFPKSPGVYLMKDAAQKIIYVGKANDLKSRVTSYFTGKDTRPMAPFLMARVHDIEFIIYRH